MDKVRKVEGLHLTFLYPLLQVFLQQLHNSSSAKCQKHHADLHMETCGWEAVWVVGGHV